MTATQLTDVERRALDAFDPDGVVTLLQELIRIPSVVDVHPEQAIGDYIAGWLREVGIEVTQEVVLPNRPNTLGTIGNGNGKTLLLNAHVDVVPYGTGWMRDPEGGELVDGKIYGRGAVDDKGPLAALLAATLALHKSGLPVNGKLIVCAVMDEENSSKGSRALMQHLRGDMGIVGEPTSGNICIAHKGSLRPMMRVDGHCAHTSRPEQGINAISKMAGVITRIDAWHKELRKREHPLTGAASAAVSIIQGGDQSNVIPDRVFALLDRRMVPGETEEQAVAEINAMFAQWMAEDPELKISIDHLRPTTGSAAQVAPDAEVVNRVSDAYRSVWGSEPTLTGMGGACDMVHLVNAGVPTVVFGPGSSSQAHQPDEHIEVDELIRCTQTVLLTAARYLCA